MSLKFDSAKKLRKEKKKWKVETPEDLERMENEFLKQRMFGKEPTIKGQVRISAGKVKNFNIDIPRNTRPLTDRMKVRVFDILGSDIANKTILDLFAGSGSFGLEALSRGAQSATFVDASRHSENIIQENVDKTGFTSISNVIKQKADEFLTQAVEDGDIYDIIFMDPPYKLYNRKKLFKIEEMVNNSGKLLEGIANPKTKKFKGAIIMKHPRRYPIDQLKLESLKKVDTYDFGLNSISLFIVA